MPGTPVPAPEPADPQEILAGIGGSWPWTLGMALTTLLPGIVVLAWPDETLHVLAVIVGLKLLVAAGFRFVTACSASSSWQWRSPCAATRRNTTADQR